MQTTGLAELSTLIEQLNTIRRGLVIPRSLDHSSARLLNNSTYAGAGEVLGAHKLSTLIEQLNPEEKRQLIKYVARDLQRTPSAPVRLSWQDAGGLGKDIWAGVDVDQYVDALRQAWDR